MSLKGRYLSDMLCNSKYYLNWEIIFSKDRLLLVHSRVKSEAGISGNRGTALRAGILLAYGSGGELAQKKGR